MPKTEVTDSLVFTVYSWFQSSMRNVGRKIDFPRCSDKTKTYQFRWTKRFVDRCYNELHLNEEIIKYLINDIVSYAKRRNLLAKGTQLLCMKNIVDICCHSIKQMVDDESSLIEELRSCRDFLLEQTNDKNTLTHILVEPVSEGGCSNLVYWYNLGYLTETYLALSKKCSGSISKLPLDEQSELPSRIKLLRICTHAVSGDLISILESVMGADLRIPPTVIKR